MGLMLLLLGFGTLIFLNRRAFYRQKKGGESSTYGGAFLQRLGDTVLALFAVGCLIFGGLIVAT